jgi:hypothetical protein
VRSFLFRYTDLTKWNGSSQAHKSLTSPQLCDQAHHKPTSPHICSYIQTSKNSKNRNLTFGRNPIRNPTSIKIVIINRNINTVGLTGLSTHTSQPHSTVPPPTTGGRVSGPITFQPIWSSTEPQIGIWIRVESLTINFNT